MFLSVRAAAQPGIRFVVILQLPALQGVSLVTLFNLSAEESQKKVMRLHTLSKQGHASRQFSRAVQNVSFQRPCSGSSSGRIMVTAWT